MVNILGTAIFYEVKLPKVYIKLAHSEIIYYLWNTSTRGFTVIKVL